MIDDYHRHEALHVANMLADIVEDHLVYHPAIQANPGWRAMAEEASEKLADLYQAIGEEHFGERPEALHPD